MPDAPDEDKLSCAAEMASYVFAELGLPGGDPEFAGGGLWFNTDAPLTLVTA